MVPCRYGCKNSKEIDYLEVGFLLNSDGNTSFPTVTNFNLQAIQPTLGKEPGRFFLTKNAWFLSYRYFKDVATDSSHKILQNTFVK